MYVRTAYEVSTSGTVTDIGLLDTNSNRIWRRQHQEYQFNPFLASVLWFLGPYWSYSTTSGCLSTLPGRFRRLAVFRCSASLCSPLALPLFARPAAWQTREVCESKRTASEFDLEGVERLCVFQTCPGKRAADKVPMTSLLEGGGMFCLKLRWTGVLS